MYRFMDEQEIQIRMIDRLKMIHIYDLAGTNNDSEAEKNVSAMAVYYDDNQQINLCEMDKNYNILVNRVLELYSESNDRNSIIIDPETKEMLDFATEYGERVITDVGRVGKKYMDMESEPEPRFNCLGYVRKALMPMIQYLLKELYSLWDIELVFDNKVGGWLGRCIIKADKNGENVMFPINVDLYGMENVSVIISNFLEDKNQVKFDISYQQDTLNIYIESVDYELDGEIKFSVNENDALIKTCIRLCNRIVYYNEEKIQAVLDDDIITQVNELLPDLISKNATVYQLPWKSYYLRRVEKNSCDTLNRYDYDTEYIDVNQHTLSIRKKAWSFIENKQNGINLKTGGAMYEHIVPDIKDGFVQTYFYPVGYYSGWNYKEKLENKYFYEDMKGNS